MSRSVGSSLVLVLFAALPACGETFENPTNTPTAVDLDKDGATSGRDCDDDDSTVYPGAPELCDGKDNDCDEGTTDETDNDGDGFSPCGGDCNDADPMIAPDAVELLFQADGETPDAVDNDCDGLTDEPRQACDYGALDRTNPDDYARAIDACANVVSAAFSDGSDSRSRQIALDFGDTYVPTYGARMITLATGLAIDKNTIGWVATDSGTEFSNTHSHPDPQPDPDDDCGSADPHTVNDYTELRLELQVPRNATALAFDFNFMTAEYPEFVCTEYDDTFLALLEQPAPGFNGNVSFDARGRPVTVNIGFFTVCRGGGDCVGDAALTGTGYEGGVGGGTGWLTTTAPVTPGTTITMRFIIFDEGDRILDSAVLIDDFRWEAGGGPPITKPP
jgi:hypothetical protein